MDELLAHRVRSRSLGMCEAMIKLPRAWARCGRTDIQIHHRLTRARGGLLLDEVGEMYHLMALCWRHHNLAHDNEAFKNGLLLPGYALRFDTKVLYQGEDPYLSEVYR